jgi:hypothetical protein
MDYETRQALANKVEKWEFHALQSENQRLKGDINELQRKLDYTSGQFQNTQAQLRNLIDGIIEHYSYMMPESEEDFMNRLEQIKNSY